MSDIRLWIGPAKSGKSARIVSDILRLTKEYPIGPPIFWVVPDDVAFAAEQMLMHHTPSVLRAEVITPTRLAQRIRDAVGSQFAQPINLTGKRLLLAAAYRDLREELGPLRRAQTNPGFYQLILDTFDEMIAHEINLAALEGALESAAASLDEGNYAPLQFTTGQSLIGKLRDLCLLYVRYRNLLSERQFFDPALNLDAAASVVPDVEWLSESIFYFDEFQLLTPQEANFFATLSERAKSVTWTSPLPETTDIAKLQTMFTSSKLNSDYDTLHAHNSALQEQSLFHMPGVAYSLARFLEVLRNKGLSYRVEVVQNETGEDLSSNHLAAFESVLRSTADFVLPSLSESISLRNFQSDELEAHRVADEIVQIVEHSPTKYRDIAVVVPSLQEYGPRLQAAFRRQEIPHVIDLFPPLSAHPLGRFCLAAIRMVTDELSTDAVATYLRTEYCGLNESDADWLDMYLRTHAVHGPANWFTEETWSFEQVLKGVDDSWATRQDERADRLRRRICASIEPFFTSVNRSEFTPAEMAQALWTLLVSVDAKKQVADQVTLSDEGNNPLEASLGEQAWQQVIQLLDDLATVYQDALYSREEMFDLVRDAFLTQRQSTIPSGVDQVLVSTYAHAHMWSKQVVFVLGMDEQSLPAKVSQEGLLRDDERQVFYRLFGVKLGWTVEDQIAIQRIVPYVLLTRATNSLFLSFVSERAGRAFQASPIFNRVQKSTQVEIELFLEGDSSQYNLSGLLGPVPVIRPSTALDWFVEAVTESDVSVLELQEKTLQIPVVRDIATWFTQSPNGQSTLLKSLRGLDHALPQGRLTPETAKVLYGLPLRTSVNRLETYAACPYRYFVRYGLGVEPMTVGRVQAADVGNLLHDVVFDLVNLERNADRRLSKMSLEEVLTLSEELFQAQLNEEKHAVFRVLATREARAFDLVSYVRAIAEVMWLHAKNSEFTPFQLEWSFDFDQEAAKPFTLRLDDGQEVVIRGRVDRVDVYEDEETVWFRIIDYKSGSNQKIDLTKLYFGLQMQLLLYAAMVRAHIAAVGEGSEGLKNVAPAGVFYMPLLKQTELADIPVSDAEANANRKKVFKPHGYMADARGVIEAMDHHLVGGKSELFPDVLRQNGEFRKTARVWSEDQWDSLLAFTIHRVKSIATHIVNGDIPVAPYIYAHNDRACTTCPFQAVCHFEPVDHAHAYRVASTKRLNDIVQVADEGGFRE